MSALCVRALLAASLWLAAASQAAELPVILVYGDSLSAGYGLPQGKSWSDLLRQRIEQQRLGYRVINASISGETTLGGLNRLPGTLAQHRPRIVLIELGANDGLRGQPLDTMRANLEQMIRASQAADAKVLLVGMRIPPNYGPDYTERFRAAYAAAAQATRVPLVPFLLEGLADKRELFQADGIHPGVEAQALLLDNVWKALQPMLRASKRKRRAEMLRMEQETIGTVQATRPVN
jgi:acyl-CoA thioesterase I